MANFHRYLHNHGGHERIDLTEYLREILPDIGMGIGIRCVLVVEPGASMEISAQVARSLTIIVNELA